MKRVIDWLFHPVTFFAMAVVAAALAWDRGERVHQVGGSQLQSGSDRFAAFEGYAIYAAADGSSAGLGALSGLLFFASAYLYAQRARSS